MSGEKPRVIIKMQSPARFKLCTILIKNAVYFCEKVFVKTKQWKSVRFVESKTH